MGTPSSSYIYKSKSYFWAHGHDWEKIGKFDGFNQDKKKRPMDSALALEFGLFGL